MHFFEYIVESEVIMGISAICGIISFILTIALLFRTAKINQILKQNTTILTYNKERIGYQNTFEGHRKSILEDGIRSDALLKQILKDVEEYRYKFDNIISFYDKIRLHIFVKILKKESSSVNYNSVCNSLAQLSGRLAKREDKKNAN